MADDFNPDHRFYRLTIPPAQIDCPVPRPGPYLFQRAEVQHQFHQSPLQFMPHRPHVSPAKSPDASSESSSIDDMSQPGSSRSRCLNWSDAETRFLLEFLKVPRFCNLNLICKRLKFRVKFHSENRCHV